MREHRTDFSQKKVLHYMTQNDIRLIEEARKVPYTMWENIDELIERAETEDTKRQLNLIQSMKYHREESDI